MICAHCSTPVADEARFCSTCGSLVSDAEGQAAATAAMDQSAFAHMERLLREDTAGVYNVQHMLGRGGMAVVYLATEIGLSRKVALKVLPPELTFGHGVERFKREARTAAALDHPHIIPIYRIGDSGKLFWYAMKFLEGKSLEDLLREQGSLGLDETVDILEQVADALDYAHDHKVIHRDIKPANIMLDNRNRVIVTDFGIAKALSEGKLTATDSVIGTPYFMSPEQGMGKPVSGAADQYSVAVMAYRMLAGHVPFDGDSAIDILHKHCMFPAPSLADDAPDLPDHVVQAVSRALSKTADERFLSVSDFVQAMKDPDFVPKERPRASGATVVLTADDAKKMRSVAGTKPGMSNPGARNPSSSNPGRAAGTKGSTGKGKTVQASIGNDDRTVVASSGSVRAGQTAKGATRAPTAEPEAKSKTGLFVGVGVVVLAAAGFGVMQLTKAPAPEPAPSAVQSAPSVTPPPTTTPDTQPLAAATPEPVVTEPAPTRAADPKNTARQATSTARIEPPPATRQQPAAPTPTPAPTTQTAPAQTAPAPTTSAPAPSPSAPAAVSTGTLRIRLSPPGILEVDGRTIGEKSAHQMALPEGTHIIVVRKDGYSTETRPVDIKAGETVTLTITLQPRS